MKINVGDICGADGWSGTVEWYHKAESSPRKPLARCPRWLCIIFFTMARYGSANNFLQVTPQELVLDFMGQVMLLDRLIQ